MAALAQRLYLSKSMLNRLMDISWRLRKYIAVSTTRGLRLPRIESKKRNFLAKSLITSQIALALVKQDSEALRHHYTISGEGFFHSSSLYLSDNHSKQAKFFSGGAGACSNLQSDG